MKKTKNSLSHLKERAVKVRELNVYMKKFLFIRTQLSALRISRRGGVMKISGFSLWDTLQFRVRADIMHEIKEEQSVGGTISFKT